MSKYRSVGCGLGFSVTQVQCQFTPFNWSLGIGYGAGSFGIAIGPFGIRFWLQKFYKPRWSKWRE